MKDGFLTKRFPRFSDLYAVIDRVSRTYHSVSRLVTANNSFAGASDGYLSIMSRLTMDYSSCFPREDPELSSNLNKTRLKVEWLAIAALSTNSLIIITTCHWVYNPTVMLMRLASARLRSGDCDYNGCLPPSHYATSHSRDSSPGLHRSTLQYCRKR